MAASWEVVGSLLHLGVTKNASAGAAIVSSPTFCKFWTDVVFNLSPAKMVLQMFLRHALHGLALPGSISSAEEAGNS